MPNAALTLHGEQAALRLEAHLRTRTGQAPERLNMAAMRRQYPRRRYVAGWRFGVTFSDDVPRRMDVVATAGFPVVPVRTALVDHPPFMTWPHVESDGILCLLPNMAECDPDDPCAVAENLLGRSVSLVEELLEGTIIERDFREEFLTYWAYKAHRGGERLYSLLTPAPPSRVVRIWRGNRLEIIGQDQPTLAKWVRHRFGPGTNTTAEEAVFMWLQQPPLPSDYPTTARDLRTLAAAAGPDAETALGKVVSNAPDNLVVVLGATGRGGPGLIAVTVAAPKRRAGDSRSTADPLSKGFRPGRTPKRILANRYLGANGVSRSGVQRADATWVHGRDRDPRTARLLAATVVLVGCGSIGAPVACTLAQGGVGRIVIVDHDTLSWPNVGRHPLGASAVGRHKADALAERLQADFPHLSIEARTSDLHWLLQSDAELLRHADLIVSATGSWQAESALNHWHVAEGRSKPVLYAWTEPHACAGHAVAIGADGGCFQCNMGRTGIPSFSVVEWPGEHNGTEEEPACGAHYSPYGPVELGYVTAMVSDVALDCLLDPPSRSFSRVVTASQRRIDALGGRWSEEWLAGRGKDAGSRGVSTADQPWSRRTCRACGQATRFDEI